MSIEVAQPEAPALGLFDPDLDPARRRRSRRKRTPRKRTRRKKSSGTVGAKPYVIGPRGGVAWLGPKALRYDPDYDFDFDPARRRYRRRRRYDLDPARRRKLAKTRKLYGYLTPVGLIYGFLNGVNKTANPLKWYPSTIDNISNPKLPSSLDEYVQRLKGNMSFLFGVGGIIYKYLPFKLPYKTPIGKLGTGLAVGGAVGSVLDPPDEKVEETQPSAVGGIPTLYDHEKVVELMKPIVEVN